MNIWCFIGISVAAMVLSFRLLNLVMNFKKKKQKKKQLRSKTDYIYHHRKAASWQLPEFTEELQKPHNLVISNKIKVLFNLNIVTQNQRSIPSEALIQLEKNLH